MASKDVKVVVGKLLSDDQFAADFKVDADKALTQFSLTDAERSGLKELDLDQIDSSAVTLARDIDKNAIRIGALYLSKVEQ